MNKVHAAILWGAERRAAEAEKALRAIGRRDIAESIHRVEEALLAVLGDLDPATEHPDAASQPPVSRAA
jgi:hypothetical protein